MSEKHLIGFASIPVLGIGAQWIAWRFALPSILVLLLAGFAVGPIFGLLNPDKLLGDMLNPLVSLSVALILFEGGLSLKISDLKGIGKVIGNLITIGAFITWALISIAAYSFFSFGHQLSILLGSILIVTGPTVIGPLLRQLKLRRNIASILRWEGIVIDPIGAVLTVLVYEVLIVAGTTEALSVTIWILLKTLIFGGLLGLWGALIMMVIMEKHWVPEYLQEVFTLMIVISVFTLSNVMQSESGLLAVTIMGIVLANQKKVVIKHIVTFKENLTLILLSALFILLSSRLQLEDLLGVLNIKSALFVLVVLIVRPLAVLVSTTNSPLAFKERLFLSCLAPRGIVAAMIASLFAIKLETLGYMGANQIVPITFLIIISTVSIYGLLSNPIAKLLKVKLIKNKGLMIVGANDWVRKLAITLKNEGFEILLVDTNKEYIINAKQEGLNVVQGSIFSQRVQEEIELGGVGRLLAMTSSDEINLLSSIEYTSVLNPHDIYRLSPERKNVLDDSYSEHYSKGFYLFQKGISFSFINAKITAGYKVSVEPISPYIDAREFIQNNTKLIPLFIISSRGRLVIICENKPIPRLKKSKVVCFKR